MCVTSTVVKVLSLDLGCNVIMKSVFRESSYQKGKDIYCTGCNLVKTIL